MNSLDALRRRYFALSVFAALFLLLGAGAVNYAQAADAAAKAPGQTLPPLKPFEKKVLTTKIKPGDTVEYQITFDNATRKLYSGSLVGLTDTLPTGLIAVGPVTANIGTAGSGPQVITWTGQLDFGDKVKITYPVRVSPDLLTATLTNTAVLWEIRGTPGTITPTNKTLTATAVIEVRLLWPEAYLPNISVPEPTPTALPPIGVTQLANWDFEAGGSGAWLEQSNGKASKMIYRNGEKITLVLPPYQGQANNYFVWLGGEYSAANVLQQSITTPAGLTQMSLTFDAWIESADDCGHDTAHVFVNSQEIGVYQLCKNNNSPLKPETGGWARQRLDISKSGVLNGQAVAVRFEVRTNEAKNSNWYIDNVRLCSTDPRAVAEDRCQ